MDIKNISGGPFGYPSKSDYAAQQKLDHKKVGANQSEDFSRNGHRKTNEMETREADS